MRWIQFQPSNHFYVTFILILSFRLGLRMSPQLSIPLKFIANILSHFPISSVCATRPAAQS